MGDVRGAVADDERRRGARRHLADRALRHRRHLRDGFFDLGLRLKEDFNDRDAGERLALDVVDVVDDGGEEALEVAGDAPAPCRRAAALRSSTPPR